MITFLCRLNHVVKPFSPETCLKLIRQEIIRRPAARSSTLWASQSASFHAWSHADDASACQIETTVCHTQKGHDPSHHSHSPWLRHEGHSSDPRWPLASKWLFTRTLLQLENHKGFGFHIRTLSIIPEGFWHNVGIQFQHNISHDGHFCEVLCLIRDVGNRCFDSRSQKSRVLFVYLFCK